jgi:hypothetical protein
MSKEPPAESNSVAQKAAYVRTAYARTILAFIAFPMGAVVGWAVTRSDAVSLVSAAVAGIVFMVCGTLQSRAPCPQCGNRFFYSRNGWCNLWRRKCGFCGFDLDKPIKEPPEYDKKV